MRRIFGAPKKKEPPPTLEQAGANLDARGTRIDEQIKKLDAQLMGFREQIKKTRPGPAQEALKRRALTVSCWRACAAVEAWVQLPHVHHACRRTAVCAHDSLSVEAVGAEACTCNCSKV